MADDFSVSDVNSGAAHTIAALDRLFPRPRKFAVRLWDGRELAADAPPAFTLTLNHPAALRQMFKIPLELSLAEAFIYGDFELEGDIFAVFAEAAATFSAGPEGGEGGRQSG
ncbi:MAG: hypothetical protein ACE5G8_12370, partial [Anaerolineae bacterium]